ncbi:MAG: hypothetical protein ACTIH2_07790 [Anaerococcus sp.]
MSQNMNMEDINNFLIENLIEQKKLKRVWDTLDEYIYINHEKMSKKRLDSLNSKVNKVVIKLDKLEKEYKHYKQKLEED